MCTWQHPLVQSERSRPWSTDRNYYMAGSNHTRLWDVIAVSYQRRVSKRLQLPLLKSFDIFRSLFYHRIPSLGPLELAEKKSRKIDIIIWSCLPSDGDLMLPNKKFNRYALQNVVSFTGRSVVKKCNTLFFLLVFKFEYANLWSLS